MGTDVERLKQVDRDEITSPELAEIVDKAERSKSPPIAWYPVSYTHLTLPTTPYV